MYFNFPIIIINTKAKGKNFVIDCTAMHGLELLYGKSFFWVIKILRKLNLFTARQTLDIHFLCAFLKRWNSILTIICESIKGNKLVEDYFRTTRVINTFELLKIINTNSQSIDEYIFLQIQASNAKPERRKNMFWMCNQ